MDNVYEVWIFDDIKRIYKTIKLLYDEYLNKNEETNVEENF